MEISGLNGNEISERNKEALQFETCQDTGKAVRTEAKHFTTGKKSTDNAYGWTWDQVVKEYLRTGYKGEDTQLDVVVLGVTYKVLKRREVTAFYDADGNTLFDVENKRLEMEYEWLVGSKARVDMKNEKEDAPPDGAGAAGDVVPAEKTSLEDVGGQETKSAKQAAKEKLEKERKAAKDRTFANPIIEYLLKRCEEDEGLAQDVMQGHKTWQKCFDYIFSQARKQSKGNCAAVRDDVVYEWAEDYYHKDDKAEEEKKAKKEADAKSKRKKATTEKKASAKGNSTKAAAAQMPIREKKEEKAKEQPKKNSKDMEGQLTMFSMMGM